jgi:hypothetical protein
MGNRFAMPVATVTQYVRVVAMSMEGETKPSEPKKMRQSWSERFLEFAMSDEGFGEA